MKTIQSVSLFFQEGTSDKVYNATLFEEGGLHTVAVEWGRRSGPLNKGNKAVGVSLREAQKVYDRLVREKTGKGYEEVKEGRGPAAVAPPVGQGSATRVAGTSQRARMGQAAQLLNAVEEEALEALFADAGILAQQKFDGVRTLLHVEATVVATNRSGQVSALDPKLAQAASRLPLGTLLDGEVVAGASGPTYWLFDLLKHAGADLRPRAYLERYQALEALLSGWGDPFQLVPTARTEAEKRALYRQLEAARAEGIVFKRSAAPYSAGRPASGGAQLKYKFIKSADVVITGNAGNAYQMAVHENGALREVGKVFAGTTNASRKELDDLLLAGIQPVAEVHYLYATDDRILFQPVFSQLRDDKEPADCTLAQLVQTNRAAVSAAPPAKKAARKRAAPKP